MVKGKYPNQIYNYAVRIQKSSQNKLIGSGVLFLRQLGQQPLLLTAAHVVYPLFLDSDQECLSLAFSDGAGDTQTMELNVCLKDNSSKEVPVEGNVCIHSKYLESEAVRKECGYDAALIMLPWEKWMETHGSFLIEDSQVEDKLKGWGFPESMDGEVEIEIADILAGKKEIHGSVNHIEKVSKRFSFTYDMGSMEKGVSRESIMQGFSGSGLFDTKDGSTVLKGVVSRECGSKPSGQMLWAGSSMLFLELMEENQIAFQCPDSFEPYKNMIAECFPKTRQNARNYFVDCSEELIEGKGLLPKEFECDAKMELQCFGNRKFCSTFWMGELKRAVILYSINKGSDWKQVFAHLDLPSPYENDTVQLQFLCTEQQAESVMGEIVEKDYFSEQGNLGDGTVFILNGEHSGDLHRVYPRAECREIICNIAGDYSGGNLKRKAEHLLQDTGLENKFDIIKGSIAQCNLAAVGIERLMAIIDKKNFDETTIREQMEDLLTEIWEI